MENQQLEAADEDDDDEEDFKVTGVSFDPSKVVVKTEPEQEEEEEVVEEVVEEEVEVEEEEEVEEMDLSYDDDAKDKDWIPSEKDLERKGN